jgi:hypothetical protein
VTLCLGGHLLPKTLGERVSFSSVQIIQFQKTVRAASSGCVEDHERADLAGGQRVGARQTVNNVLRSPDGDHHIVTLSRKR